MTNSTDPDQLASSVRSQLIWIYTVYKDRVYPGSAGQGLMSNIFLEVYQQKAKSNSGGQSEALSLGSTLFDVHLEVFSPINTYRIWPNYCTFCLGLSKLLEKLVVKISHFKEGSAEDFMRGKFNDAYVIFFLWLSL